MLVSPAEACLRTIRKKTQRQNGARKRALLGRDRTLTQQSDWLTEASTALQRPYAYNTESVTISWSISLTGAIRATDDVDALLKGFCE